MKFICDKCKLSVEGEKLPPTWGELSVKCNLKVDERVTISLKVFTLCPEHLNTNLHVRVSEDE